MGALNNINSKIMRILLSAFFKGVLISLLLGFILLLTFYSLVLTGVYSDLDSVSNDIMPEDLFNGMLEDSEIYKNNRILSGLPILKYIIPLAKGGIASLFNEEEKILMNLNITEIASVFIYSLANTIILLPSLRIYDKIAVSYNNKFKIGFSVLEFLLDMLIRLQVVFLAVISSIMLAVSISQILMPFSDHIKIVIAIIVILISCFISSILHKKIFLSNSNIKILDIFLSFAKNIFVDLLYTFTSLFVIGSLIILISSSEILTPYDMITLLCGSFLGILIMFFAIKLGISKN